MAELSAEETDRATSAPIHDLGSAFMLHKETMARGVENGFENPFSFYFAGRGGVLGDVDADVICSTFGWFSPEIVRPMWEDGIAVHGARPATSRYFLACAEWGRDHLAGVDDLDRFADMAARLVEAAETSGRPLFAAWSCEPRVDDGPGRAMQLVHVLREWRGANHLVATTAIGLSPLEAVVTDRPGQARFMGWPEPYPELTDELRKRHDEAEALTDRLCAPAFEALSPDERVAFAAIVPAMFEAATT
jgi:Helix-turn-helix family